MKRISAIAIVFYLFSMPVLQAEDGKIAHLQAFLDTDASIQANPQVFTSFLSLVEKKQAGFKRDEDFLRFMFFKTHQKFLKTYQKDASFGALLTNGNYNCLTGTALYALMLDYFKIDYSIIETNYHIFILAKADGKEVLMETTDPLKGFITNKREIEERLSSYRKNTLQENIDKESVHYTFNFDLWENVSLAELTGLLYFNNAVKAYNVQDYESATRFIKKSLEYRPSERIEEFSKVVTLSVVESNLPDTSKADLIKQLRTARRQCATLLTVGIGQ